MDFFNILKVIILSSLVGSIIVLTILIIKGMFRNKLNPTFQYYIWIILLMKLIIPFGPQTSLNISKMYENFYTLHASSENIQTTQINSSKQSENTSLGGQVSISAFEPPNKSVISSTMNIPLKNKVDIGKVLCFIWTFGVILSITILAAGYKRLREIAMTSIKNINSTHKEILYNCMKAMNIKTEVELSYSQKIRSPSLCGLIKPKILIPVSVAVNICDEEFKYIIMHELTHLKNKDILLNYVITILSIIYWFNPVLLYGFHKIRQDCEISCDDQVISYLDEGENIQYGNSVIKVLELVGNSKRLIGTTSMVMNNWEIKRRIIMISKYKKINIKGTLLGIVIVFIIGGLGIAINTNKNIVEIPVTTSKNVVTTTTNGKISSVNTKSVMPSSSDIIIYNSHPDEEYISGKKVSDMGALLSDKLVKEGLKSSFINHNAPIDYIKSYEVTRKLITENVKGYENKILLDVSRDEVGNEPTKSGKTNIKIVLAKDNPHYAENKKFADLLLTELGKSTQVTSDLQQYNKGMTYFNEDLSNKCIFVEIGNNSSNDKDVEESVNILSSALKNIQNVSHN